MRKLYFVALLMIFMCVACGSNESDISFDELPTQGNVENGAQLFTASTNGSTPCSSCHMLDGSSNASPSLLGFSNVAGERVDGQSAREYAFWSIAEPGQHIVEGYGNAMPADYDDKLSTQQIADLIAYLLSLV